MYQVFISYRREGGFETAKYLNDLLRRDGYIVSFDIDTLREGDFDEALLLRIEECEDFVLVVDPHCFDRTLNPSFNPENDWLRQELYYALKLQKNVIPVLLAGARFPDNLPKDICRVPRKNGPTYSREYFDNFYSKLKSFLHSVPSGSDDRISHSAENGAIISLYTTVPCQVEERGRKLAEVLPGDKGAEIVLCKGRHRLLFVSSINEENRYYKDYTVSENGITDIIDIELTENVCHSKETKDSDRQRSNELYAEGLRWASAKDWERAFRCYYEAAKLGLANAQDSVGNCYYDGLGVPQDYSEAVKWYRKAAEQGDENAQYCLGVHYYNGVGVYKDKSEAVKWYSRAAEQGYEDAKLALKKIKK